MRAQLHLVGLLFVHGVAAAASVPEGAVAAVSAYSAAFNASDCQTMLDLMSPREKRGFGSELCTLTAQFHAEGVTDRLRAPTASLSSGPYRMVVVPNSRFGFASPDQPSITDGIYVVHSSDSGRTWHVLDLGCVNARWVKAVYPPYRGTPKVGPADLTVLSNAR